MRALAPHPAAWAAVALFLFASFLIDWANTAQGGAIDLRNRVTGVRLLLDHRDPYFYKWKEPEPAEFCDPYNNPKLPVSKTTATPAFLLLHWPVAVLTYRKDQFLWFLGQWACLMGTCFLWCRRMEGGWQRLFFAALLTGFTYTAAWRLHAERGQAYVVLLFLFALWLMWTIDGRRIFWTGVLAGILIALRPTFLLLVPFLALHRRWQLPGLVAGLVLGVILPMLWLGTCWTDYFSAMSTHSELYRTGFDPAPGPVRFPAAIEGTATDLVANYLWIPYADFSVHALLRTWEPIPAAVPLGIFLAGAAVWLWQSRKREFPELLLGLAVVIFAADLFLPAYRDSYNDVLVLNVAALALLFRPKFSWALALCFLAEGLGCIIYVTAPQHNWLIDVPSLTLTLGVLLFWFNFARRPRKV